MEKKVYSCNAELKAIGDEDDGFFEGYGSVFGNTDSYNDIVLKGAFKESLNTRGKPALLLQHDMRDVAGVYLEAYEDDRGLYLKGQLNMQVQKARETYYLLKQGAFKGLSIGFIVENYRIDNESGIRFIEKVDLLEVSLVTFPANDQANVLRVKNGRMPSEREFEKFLRDAGGYSHQEAKTIVSKGYRALSDEDNRDDYNKLEDAINESLSKYDNIFKT